MVRLIFLFVLLLSNAAQAEVRAAFVVGNSDYEHATALANPTKDAKLISKTLEDLGFKVSTHFDLSRDELGRSFAKFLTENQDADLTFFYFAGHGMQYEGRNYLIGTDARLETEFDIEGETVALDKMARLMRKNSKAALIFIDACRDNPLADQFYRDNFSQTRALVSRGLAPVEHKNQGAMMLFAASPGQVAFDGDGGNSPFATALAAHLPAENVEVLSLMKRVIRDVKRDTDNKQTPIVSNDLTQDIYLNLSSSGEGVYLVLEQEQALFDAAMSINSERTWEIFLDRFPNGALREMAVAVLEDIAAERLAAASGTSVQSDETVKVTREVASQAEENLGLTKDDAKAIQAALNLRGYAAGPEDGQIGRKTRQAIADFQAAEELPSTGVVTAGTAAALGVELVAVETSTVPIISSTNARRYDPEALSLLETDPRLLKAAKALRGKEFVYGYYEDRLYLGVLNWCCDSFAVVNKLAEKAGGHLATMTSPAENDFVYNLIKDDTRFWQEHDDGAYTGPVFGLYQTEGAREPDGGWVWVTGEPNDWIPWLGGEPNNGGRGKAMMAMFFNHTPPTGPRWGDSHAIHTAIVIEIE